MKKMKIDHLLTLDVKQARMFPNRAMIRAASRADTPTNEKDKPTTASTQQNHGNRPTRNTLEPRRKLPSYRMHDRMHPMPSPNSPDTLDSEVFLYTWSLPHSHPLYPSLAAYQAAPNGEKAQVHSQHPQQHPQAQAHGQASKPNKAIKLSRYQAPNLKTSTVQRPGPYMYILPRPRRLQIQSRTSRPRRAPKKASNPKTSWIKLAVVVVVFIVLLLLAGLLVGFMLEEHVDEGIPTTTDTMGNSVEGTKDTTQNKDRRPHTLTFSGQMLVSRNASPRELRYWLEHTLDALLKPSLIGEDYLSSQVLNLRGEQGGVLVVFYMHFRISHHRAPFETDTSRMTRYIQELLRRELQTPATRSSHRVNVDTLKVQLVERSS